MKIETHTMPARWASALVDGDMSSLDGEGRHSFYAYITANPEFKNPVSCSEDITLDRFTFSLGVTLLTECLDYTFLRGE